MTTQAMAEQPSAQPWSARLRGIVVTCAGAPCRRFTISHRLLRRDGIRLNGAWYCGSDCFLDALHRLLRAVPRGAQPTERELRRVPFHHFLLRWGAIAELPLQRAMRVAADTRHPLQEILLQEGVTRDQIAMATAQAAGLPLCSTLSGALPPDARMPRGFMERFGVAPVAVSGRTLLLGCAEDAPLKARHAVAAVTGYAVRACLLPRDIYATAAMRARPERCEEKTPDTLEQGCGHILAQAVQQGAEDVHLACGTDWLWARLRERRHSDLFLSIGGSAIDMPAI